VTRRALASALFVATAVLACGKRDGTPKPPAPATTLATSTAAPKHLELENADIVVPEGASAAKPVPFILLLHGLGHSGPGLAEQFRFAELSRSLGFAYAAPSGAFDASGRRFWNAWTACCDFDPKKPDHVSALRALLDEAAKNPALDPKRRHVLGFSNGGFMAHRLACEVPGLAAIASIAGSGPAPGETCRPSGPVAVLQVHGDADQVIAYGGGHTLGDPSLPVHPSAPDVMKAWAERNGCGRLLGTPPTLDLEPDLPGEETRVLRYPGCRRSTELWRVEGGGHVVAVKPGAVERVIEFLEQQRAE